jgi:hypothetical protein
MVPSRAQGLPPSRVQQGPFPPKPVSPPPLAPLPPSFSCSISRLVPSCPVRRLASVDASPLVSVRVLYGAGCRIYLSHPCFGLRLCACECVSYASMLSPISSTSTLCEAALLALAAPPLPHLDAWERTRHGLWQALAGGEDSHYSMIMILKWLMVSLENNETRMLPPTDGLGARPSSAPAGAGALVGKQDNSRAPGADPLQARTHARAHTCTHTRSKTTRTPPAPTPFRQPSRTWAPSPCPLSLSTLSPNHRYQATLRCARSHCRHALPVRESERHNDTDIERRASLMSERCVCVCWGLTGWALLSSAYCMCVWLGDAQVHVEISQEPQPGCARAHTHTYEVEEASGARAHQPRGPQLQVQGRAGGDAVGVGVAVSDVTKDLALVNSNVSRLGGDLVRLQDRVAAQHGE